jgi:hypothetical protein
MRLPSYFEIIMRSCFTDKEARLLVDPLMCLIVSLDQASKRRPARQLLRKRADRTVSWQAD